MKLPKFLKFFSRATKEIHIPGVAGRPGVIATVPVDSQGRVIGPDGKPLHEIVWRDEATGQIMGRWSSSN